MQNIKSIYFIGAGGIGMSALVRYFLHNHFFVGGYDLTSTPLTKELEKEGAELHYEDNVAAIPEACHDPATTLVVYTPAIPSTHSELQWFRTKGFRVCKRAEVLGELTRQMKGLCVAGTHGKTTTTSMTAHLLHESHVGCNAFLGGITKNYGTNYLVNAKSDFVVIEADEFDRSFHHLTPFATVITATDADHLDIYGTEEAYLESFKHYTSLIQPGGTLIVHRGLKMQEDLQAGVKRYDYSRTEGDFHAENLRIGNGRIVFDLISPLGNIEQVELGVPVAINIDNGIAAMALAQIAGATADEIRKAMASYKGVDRRFDFHIKNEQRVFLSDYAHHPQEILQCLKSLREVFGSRRLSVFFQSHLYTRTRDFYREFAESLSLADEVYLTEIYPAREEPIAGVSSDLIYQHLSNKVQKFHIKKADIGQIVQERDFDILLFLGAGDIDNWVPEVTKILEKKGSQ